MVTIESILYFAVYFKLIIFIIILITVWRYKKIPKDDGRIKDFIKFLVILMVVYNFIDVVNSAVVGNLGKDFYIAKNKSQDSLYVNNQLINSETNLRIDSLLAKNIDDKIVDSLMNKQYHPDKFNKAILPYVKITRKLTEYNNIRINDNIVRINKNTADIQKLKNNDNRSSQR